VWAHLTFELEKYESVGTSYIQIGKNMKVWSHLTFELDKHERGRLMANDA
jgi:hypothetical protein